MDVNLDLIPLNPTHWLYCPVIFQSCSRRTWSPSDAHFFIQKSCTFLMIQLQSVLHWECYYMHLFRLYIKRLAVSCIYWYFISIIDCNVFVIFSFRTILTTATFSIRCKWLDNEWGIRGRREVWKRIKLLIKSLCKLMNLLEITRFICFGSSSLKHYYSY